MTDDVLSRLHESRLPDVPFPAVDHELAHVTEGDVVAFAIHTGPEVTLRFPTAFEPFLRLDGRRLVESRNQAERVLLMWMGRHLPMLARTLEDRRGLRAILVGREVRLLELVDLESGTLIDHSGMRVLADAGLALPKFAVLGPASSRSELMTRLRSLYAAGTTVELRGEEMGKVRWRGRVEVER